MTNKEIEAIMEKLQIQINQANQKINHYGLIRLGLLLALGACLMALIVEKNLAFILPSILLAMALAYFIVAQDKYKESQAHDSAKVNLYQRILEAKKGIYPASGESVAENDAYYIGDLDVVGKDSLYDCLAFSQMQAGLKCLRDRLCQPLENKEEIIEMQGVFQELGRHEVSLDFLCQEATLKMHKKAILTSDDLKPLPSMPLYLKILTYVYPWILGLCILTHRFDYVAYLVLTSLCVVGLHFRFFSNGYDLTSQRVSLTSCFDTLSEVVLKASFENEKLKAMQRELAMLMTKKKQLAFLDQMLKVRYNPLLLMILDGLCFYDGWLYLILEKQQKATYLLEMQAGLARFSALSSMAQWAKIKENLCYPTISQELVAKDLKHPLMNSEKAVGADFDFSAGSVVITGSNMAGKTTFMRNIGLNLVLFYCGLGVDALQFEAPLLQIHTSMRVADKISEGVSTFYGELLRIKCMVEASQNNIPCLYLIDEIFKGTNLKDRIIGAKATIEKLNHPHSFLFVSTHDEALTSHDGVNIRNIHFEEYYENNEIFFDYKPKEGIAQTTNAKYLMKMIGLLE